jgi:hypothetical protein
MTVFCNVTPCAIVNTNLWCCVTWCITAYRSIQEYGDEKDIWAKKEKLIEDWRKLYNKKLHNLYSVLNINWMIISRVHGIYGDRNIYRILMGKQTKDTTWRPKHIRKTIKMHIKETGWENMNQIQAQDVNCGVHNASSDFTSQLTQELSTSQGLFYVVS